MIERPKVNEQAFLAIDSIAQFWQLKRKKLSIDLKEHLTAAQQQLDTLFDGNKKLSSKCEDQSAQIASLSHKNEDLYSQIKEKNSNLALIQESLKQEKERLNRAKHLLVKSKRYIDELKKNQHEAESQIAELGIELDKNKKVVNDKKLSIDSLKSSLADFELQLEELNEARRNLLNQCAEHEEKIYFLNSQSDELSSQLEAKTKRIGRLELALDNKEDQLAKKENFIAILEQEKEQLTIAVQKQEKNFEDVSQAHMTLTEKFGLVSQILASKPPKNEGLYKLSCLIQNDFLAFANSVSSLADEASALIEIQKILSEIEMLNKFPSITGKTILSIAGGFSSGKSEFLNSFITNQSVRLATGLNPVTVIPSYVVCSEETKIKAYSKNGGGINLKPKIYESLSHEYVQTFGFDLRAIMPFISVKVKMNPEHFSNLCIIDTPGYNPGHSGGTTELDYHTAFSLVNQSSAMIWVIGLDPAGTISQSDIDFIQSTPFGMSSDHPLYILLNKADLRSEEDIEQIMEQVSEDLELEGVEYNGICAYSSSRKKEYSIKGVSLSEFLKKVNNKVDVIGRTLDKINSVFNKYIKAIDSDIDKLRSSKSELESFKMQALEVVGTTVYSEIENILPDYDEILDTSNLLKQRSDCEEIRKKFIEIAEEALNPIMDYG